MSPDTTSAIVRLTAAEIALRATLAEVLGDAIHAPECGPYSNAPCVCLIGRVKAVLNGTLTAAGCTGLTADWCPVHGTCRCRASRYRCDIECTLHAPDSQHPIPSPGGPAPAGGYLRTLYELAVGEPEPGCELGAFLARQDSPNFMAAFIAEQLVPGGGQPIRHEDPTGGSDVR